MARTGNGARTNVTGVEVGVDFTVADKVWRIFTAVGNMAFACAYSSILIEIQVRNMIKTFDNGFFYIYKKQANIYIYIVMIV